MDQYIFPAIFQLAEEGGYFITFPDLPGCITEGNSIEESLRMAKESLELFIYNIEDENMPVPSPTLPEKIPVIQGSFVVPVVAWMPTIRAEMDNKMVSKNCTIPKWLNDVALQQGVNFSQILQIALKDHLGMGCRQHFRQNPR